MKKIIGVTVGTPTNPREIAKEILVHSDWGQNNPADNSYVKNRTHWQESSKTVVTWNGNTANRLTYTNALNEVFYQISKECPSEEDILGATIEYSDGNIVKVTSKHFTGFTDGAALIGNSLYAINKPKALPGNVLDNTVIGLYAKAGNTYPAAFTYGDEVIHPLDEKFIPESIARKEDIEPSIEAYIAEHPTMGQPGKDGFSPTAIVAESTDGATITITDKNGTTYATVKHGRNGAKGDTGADGFSPTAIVTESTDGATIAITDKNGTTYATVKRGPQGIQGVKGDKGEKGDKGNPGDVSAVGGFRPDPDGNVRFDWVARKDEDPVYLELGTVSAGFNSSLKYEMFEGLDEVAVTCDGRLYMCVPEFGYAEGDGYYYYVGNKYLLSSSQPDTGEPFLFNGYKGTASVFRFKESGSHEVSVYGYKITANPLPEEYLPACVVKSVNGAKPDENGNVNVSASGGADLSEIVLYYASLSGAIADINEDQNLNAEKSSKNAKVSVFTAHTGAKTVMLLDNVSESTGITVNKDIDLVLNGKTLNLTTAASVLTFGAGTKCRIYGEVPGSAIVMDGANISANTVMITTNGDFFQLHGGNYTMKVGGSYRTTLFLAGATSGRCEIYDAVMSVTNTTDGQVRVIQSQATKGMLVQNVSGEGYTNGQANGLFLGGNIDARNSIIRVRSVKGGVCTANILGGCKLSLKDCKMYATCTNGWSDCGEVKEGAMLYAENTLFFADATDCHVKSPDLSAVGLKVLAGGEAHLTNCEVVGTHSGVSAHGNLYANGGIYKGFCHGGVYVTGGGNHFINDITSQCGNYEGEFDYSGKTEDIYGSMYIGGNAEANDLTAYLDGCTIANANGNAIVMRGTDGEHDNTIYISNSTVEGTVRIDNDTLKLYVGVGTDITTDKIDNPGRAGFADELYRRNSGDKVLNGKDYEALRNQPVTVEIPSGGGSGVWEKVCRITLEEAVANITYDIPDEYIELYVTAVGLLESATQGAISAIDFTDTFKLAQSGQWHYSNNASRGVLAHFKIMEKKIIGIFTSTSPSFYSNSSANANANITLWEKDRTTNHFGTMKIWRSADKFAANFVVDVWGYKA